MRRFAVSSLVVLVMCSHTALGQERRAPLPDRIDFNEHIRPIFNANCAACHSGVKAASGVSFVFRSMAVTAGDSGAQVIAPGDVNNSEILRRITDRDDPMPPVGHGSMLSEREVGLITRWIEQGAHWADHWAYLPPQRSRVPNTSSSPHADWPQNDIDHFILTRLDSQSLEPNPRAVPGKLLRRMSLDLTGLPPTLEELDAFLLAHSDDPDRAIESAVDRLLVSPHFGERWASMWMDLARYADSMGYEKDPHRDMWPYRDWLIDAFNTDKPYDEFMIEQLAGDLLPGAAVEQVIATAFHRNTQTNTEGGTDDEEYRVAAVIDRVNTTWEVLQGTTMRCVQCHSHPYDPIRHEEYYQAFAIFNNTQDNDDYDYPMVRVANEAEKRAHAFALHQQADALREQLRVLDAEVVRATQWRPAPVQTATTPGDGALVIEDDRVTVHAKGTIPWNAAYEIDIAPNDAPQMITAIRIDALLSEAPAGQASPGFTLSQVVARREASEEPIAMSIAAADMNRTDGRLADVLADNAGGWSTYPNLFHPHWLVLVPREPIMLAAGEPLHLVLRHLVFREGNDGTLQRFRISTTGEPVWSARANDPDRRDVLREIAEAQRARDQIKGANLPVMMDRDAASQRDTHVFLRGNWMTLGERVEPGTPLMLPEMPAANNEPPRLAFARWVASTNNPLTARVLVNRIWAEMFGTGIVRTLGDLGTQGAQPTHPQLLDHLAMQFMHEHDWQIKPLLREIVLSATYQQDAGERSVEYDQDPDNRLLARGPRVRLTAEMVRDQALRASGLISMKMHGPSVMPPQPEGIWQTVYSGAQWKPAEGEDAYRRALYTYWKRTSPYPSMLTFDAPTREVCATRRIATNTPLQAFVTFNDPVYVECAEALAGRMLGSSEDRDAQLAFGYRSVTCSVPQTDVLRELAALYADVVEQIGDVNDAEHRAMTIVASTLLNLDEAMVR